jgi:hypothetical protein
MRKARYPAGPTAISLSIARSLSLPAGSHPVGMLLADWTSMGVLASRVPSDAVGDPAERTAAADSIPGKPAIPDRNYRKEEKDARNQREKGRHSSAATRHAKERHENPPDHGDDGRHPGGAHLGNAVSCTRGYITSCSTLRKQPGFL